MRALIYALLLSLSAAGLMGILVLDALSLILDGTLSKGTGHFAKLAFVTGAAAFFFRWFTYES
jgi:hypothetical protein